MAKSERFRLNEDHAPRCGARRYCGLCGVQQRQLHADTGARRDRNADAGANAYADFCDAEPVARAEHGSESHTRTDRDPNAGAAASVGKLDRVFVERARDVQRLAVRL
jgi:hypothetical protein